MGMREMTDRSFESFSVDSMLLPFLFPWAIRSYPKGYHSFTVKYDRPFAIILKKNMLVLALDEIPSPTVNFTVFDRHNKSALIPMLPLTHLYFFETTFMVTVPKQQSYTLHYWILPTSLCSSISYAAVADHQLSFRLSSESARTDFCLFSQSGASSYTAILDYHSGSPNNRIEFYTKSTGPAKKCKQNSQCEFRSNRPFFMRVVNVTNYEFEATLNFWAFRRSIDSSECLIKPIPILIEPPIQVPMGVISITDIHCVSMAEDLLKYILIAIVVVVVASAI
jgi:hypothetical protein